MQLIHEKRGGLEGSRWQDVKTGGDGESEDESRGVEGFLVAMPLSVTPFLNQPPENPHLQYVFWEISERNASLGAFPMRGRNQYLTPCDTPPPVSPSHLSMPHSVWFNNTVIQKIFTKTQRNQSAQPNRRNKQ